jgi:hypothetical protein
VGSGTESTFYVDGLPPHAFTLYYRNGDYLVLNRGPEPLRMGRARIAPDERAVWAAGQPLWADKRTKFQLIVNGNSEPSPRASNRQDDELMEDPDDSAEEAKPNRLRQGVMVCGFVAFFYLFLLPGGDAPRRDEQAFQRMVRELLPHRDLRLVRVRSLMQEARSCDVCGEVNEAGEKYLAARRIIASARPPQDPLRGDERIARLEKRIHRFIASRTH